MKNTRAYPLGSPRSARAVARLCSLFWWRFSQKIRTGRKASLDQSDRRPVRKLFAGPSLGPRLTPWACAKPRAASSGNSRSAVSAVARCALHATPLETPRACVHQGAGGSCVCCFEAADPWRTARHSPRLSTLWLLWVGAYIVRGAVCCSTGTSIFDRGGITVLGGPCRRLCMYPGSVWRAQVQVG